MVIHGAKGDVTVTVEIADTPDTQTRGLMYRRDLAAQAGMLFLFAEASERSFWMKNTPLPLDMVFIGADKRILGIVANTKPFTTNGVGVAGASQYVLEVNGGFCAEHGLAAGDRVDFLGVEGKGQ